MSSATRRVELIRGARLTEDFLSQDFPSHAQNITDLILSYKSQADALSSLWKENYELRNRMANLDKAVQESREREQRTTKLEVKFTEHEPDSLTDLIKTIDRLID